MSQHANPHFNFLVGELVTLAWSASTQRAKCYLAIEKAETNDAASRLKAAQQRAARKRFRVDVLTFVSDRLLPCYVEGCEEEKHYENLELLIAYATEKGTEVLSGGVYAPALHRSS